MVKNEKKYSPTYPNLMFLLFIVFLSGIAIGAIWQGLSKPYIPKDSEVRTFGFAPTCLEYENVTYPFYFVCHDNSGGSFGCSMEMYTPEKCLEVVPHTDIARCETEYKTKQVCKSGREVLAR